MALISALDSDGFIDIDDAIDLAHEYGARMVNTAEYTLGSVRIVLVPAMLVWRVYYPQVGKPAVRTTLEEAFQLARRVR